MDAWRVPNILAPKGWEKMKLNIHICFIILPNLVIFYTNFKHLCGIPVEVIKNISNKIIIWDAKICLEENHKYFKHDIFVSNQDRNDCRHDFWPETVTWTAFAGMLNVIYLNLSSVFFFILNFDYVYMHNLGNIPTVWDAFNCFNCIVIRTVLFKRIFQVWYMVDMWYFNILSDRRTSIVQIYQNCNFIIQNLCKIFKNLSSVFVFS